MLTNEIRSQIDQIWNAFWSGGISNPLEVIEQITYLLFIKRLDELQTLEELKATRLKQPVERRFFPEGEDDHARSPRSYEDYRWSRFRNFSPADMYEIVGEHVFPFLRRLGGDQSTYAHHMKDARFTIPTPGLLAKVVDLIDKVPMEERDTKGDLYEYMLAKIASAGQNGQFRTPRHIIQLMVELVRPVPTDIMCDPAGGTCGFPVAVGEYLRRHYPEIFRDPKLNSHFHLMGFEREFILPGFSTPRDLERFRAKARQFLKANENHIAVYKLRMNEPLTPTDLAELERMLSESGIGNAEDVQRAKEMSQGLGLFVRALIGLDREAAKKALGSFLGGKPLRANQIEFLNLIVDHLTEHGSMDARLLYDSPYTDFSSRGVDGVFESKEVDELLSVLEEVRKRAVG